MSKSKKVNFLPSEEFERKILQLKSRQNLGTVDFACVIPKILDALSEFNQRFGLEKDATKNGFIARLSDLKRTGQILLFLAEKITILLEECFDIKIAFRADGFIINQILKLLGLKNK